MVEKEDILELIRKTEEAMIDQMSAKLVERFHYIKLHDFEKAKQATSELKFMVQTLSDQDHHLERNFKDLDGDLK